MISLARGLFFSFFFSFLFFLSFSSSFFCGIKFCRNKLLRRERDTMMKAYNMSEVILSPSDFLQAKDQTWLIQSKNFNVHQMFYLGVQDNTKLKCLNLRTPPPLSMIAAC